MIMMVGMILVLIGLMIGLMLISAGIGYGLALPQIDELEDKLQLRAIEIARLKRELQRARTLAGVKIALEAFKQEEPRTKNQEQQTQSGT